MNNKLTKEPTVEMHWGRARITPRPNPGEHYVKGPIPLNWMIAAAKMPGDTLVVGLYIWYRAGFFNNGNATIPVDRCASMFGIDGDVVVRSLRELEKNNLIQVEWDDGKAPWVCLLDCPQRLDRLEITLQIPCEAIYEKHLWEEEKTNSVCDNSDLVKGEEKNKVKINTQVCSCTQPGTSDEKRGDA